MIDFLPLDEVSVSVDEATGKSVFVDKRKLGMSVPWSLGSGNMTGSLPTSHCLDQTSRAGWQDQAESGFLAVDVSRFRQSPG